MDEKAFKYLVLTTCWLFLSCTNETDTIVRYTGALRTIMSGELGPTISLDTLAQKSNLYALGAMENLKGEVQIFDGKPFNSVVNTKEIQIDNSYDKKAALLVYTQVQEWQTLELPAEIATIEDLEEFVFDNAKALRIDTTAPFPFMIEGKVMSVDWHVIDWNENDKVNTHQKHKESGLKGRLNDAEVEIIGFFSKEHKAVFTHHTTFVHMHFKTEDAILAGHIDALELGTKMQLKLPKI